jgi:hypothetical protein
MAANRLSSSWPRDASSTRGDIADANAFTLHVPAAIVVPQAYYMQVHAAVANTVYDVTIRKRDLYWTIYENPIPNIYVALHVNITGAATHPVHEPHVTLVYNAPVTTHPCILGMSNTDAIMAVHRQMLIIQNEFMPDNEQLRLRFSTNPHTMSTWNVASASTYWNLCNSLKTKIMNVIGHVPDHTFHVSWREM